MKLSSKLLLLKLLVVFSFVCGYLLNNLTQDKNTEPNKPKKEVAIKVTKKADKKVTNVFTARRGEFVAETKNSTVDNDSDIKVVTVDCINNKIDEFNQQVLTREDIICVKPKYTSSYYRDMIRDVHIRSPMTLNVLNHVALVFRQRLGYRVDLFEFIAEVPHNPVVWEHVKDLAAGNSSP